MKNGQVIWLIKIKDLLAMKLKITITAINMKNILFTISVIFSIHATSVWASGNTQIVRGRIVDENTLQPIIGANVIIKGTDPVKGTITDLNGIFRLEQAPLGRIDLQVSYVGYHIINLNNLQVDAGKEVVLEIKMQMSINMMDDMIIKASDDTYELVNEMASASARGFNVEETKRYAGSRNDPARMASNFAGVSAANDARNDLIIRGNSPTGLLWRLEGINIPNPSHFAAVGTTGGPVSMLNNNVLTDSEFYTGAFPSTYGNAISGVFDLHMRNGNNESREYMAQIGFNGIELGAEGPFKKGNRSSYMVNYRYSVPALMQKLNLSTGTGDAVPYYQDLSYKLNFYTPQGKLSVFGLWGNSHIDLLGSETAPEDLDDNLYNGAELDIYNTSMTGIFGANYLHFLDKDTYWKNTFSISGTDFGARIDTVLRDETNRVINLYEYVDNRMKERKISWASVLHHKFNARNLFEGGINLDHINAEMFRDVYNVNESESIFNRINYMGGTFLLQAYGSWQYRFNDQLKLNVGLHYQNLFLNSTSDAIEPRLGIEYKIRGNQTLSAAYGRHHQVQAATVYFVETEVDEQTSVQTNRDLGFTGSDHVVVGYKAMIKPNLKLSAEAYFQGLFNVPVELGTSIFSMLNYGADFGVPDTDSLINGGTGRNIGLELTLEKYFSHQYYFLITGSLFDSKYTASDLVERNTAFNGNYTTNLLFGKEWQIGKKGNVIGLDYKVTYAGNRRYVPIDADASKVSGSVVYDESNAYTSRYPNYFRMDMKITYRIQAKKITQEWNIDIQNVTNHQNVYFERYDSASGEVITSYQMGIWPMFQYRILF